MILDLGNEYDHIELTEDEKKLALHIARKEKYFLLQRIEYAKKIREAEPKGWELNPVQMVQFIKDKAGRMGIRFEINEFNEEIIDNLCFYFTNKPGKYDLNKGLMFYGNPGCGKTTIMRLFQENQKCSYVINTCRDVSRSVLKAGNAVDDVIRKHSVLQKSSYIGMDFRNGKELGICFDDLGTEENVKNFGNTINAMDEVLSRCYDNHQLKGRVHLTTNLSIAQVKEFYGIRIDSRIQEMFNEVIFPVETPDYRANQKSK